MSTENKFLREVDQLGRALTNLPHENFSFEAFSRLKAIRLDRLFGQEILPQLRERHSENSPLILHDCVFSDECLVLFVHETFTIELYHWLYSDTGIHDHNFQGAFQCLEGEDHQIEFLFERKEVVFEGLERGSLTEISNKILRPGDSQEIRNKDFFIHAVAHSPSTYNLCIRSTGDKEQVLNAYHTEGYRYALRREREERLERTDLNDLKLDEFESTDLLHLFHMLGGKNGHFQIQERIDEVLGKRHGLSYLELMEKTSSYLNQLGRIAKDY